MSDQQNIVLIADTNLLREKYLEMIEQFFGFVLPAKGFIRLRRTGEELEQNISVFQDYAKEQYEREALTNDWNLCVKYHRTSLFGDKFSLKKAVIYLRRMGKRLNYNIKYQSFPQYRLISITDQKNRTIQQRAEEGQTIPNLQPARSFKVHYGQYQLYFNSFQPDIVPGGGLLAV